MDIYVVNLSITVIEQELQEACKAFGRLASFNIIKDRYSGTSNNPQGRVPRGSVRGYLQVLVSLDHLFLS